VYQVISFPEVHKTCKQLLLLRAGGLAPVHQVLENKNMVARAETIPETSLAQGPYPSRLTPCYTGPNKLQGGFACSRHPHTFATCCNADSGMLLLQTHTSLDHNQTNNQSAISKAPLAHNLVQ
jgi:hypothetical protein